MKPTTAPERYAALCALDDLSWIPGEENSTPHVLRRALAMEGVPLSRPAFDRLMAGLVGDSLATLANGCYFLTERGADTVVNHRKYLLWRADHPSWVAPSWLSILAWILWAITLISSLISPPK